MRTSKGAEDLSPKGRKRRTKRTRVPLCSRLALLAAAVVGCHASESDSSFQYINKTRGSRQIMMMRTLNNNLLVHFNIIGTCTDSMTESLLSTSRGCSQTVERKWSGISFHFFTFRRQGNSEHGWRLKSFKNQASTPDGPLKMAIPSKIG